MPAMAADVTRPAAGTATKILPSASEVALPISLPSWETVMVTPSTGSLPSPATIVVEMPGPVVGL